MPPVFIPLDRPAALVRGLWRLLAASILGGFVAFLARDTDWEQYWRNQRLVGMCLAFVLVILALPASALAWSGIRWVAAALAKGLGVELNDRDLVVRSGPFGNHSFDWPRVSIRLDGDLPLETWAALPEDSVGVSLFHPSATGEVSNPIRTLLGSRSTEFMNALRDRVTQLPHKDE